MPSWYSEVTGNSYPSMQAVVEAEAEGWAVTIIITNTRTGEFWPWSHGLYKTKAEANKARNRYRYRIKMQDRQYPHHTYRFFVRPIWKDKR